MNANALIYDPLLRRALSPLRRAVARMLPAGKDSRILDLCCGTGEQLYILREQGYRDLHGVDLSREMLEVAGSKAPDIRFYREDAACTSFPDASFDAVTISLALHDKDRHARRNILLEIRRLLAPGGSAAVADFCFDGASRFGGRSAISAVEWFAGGEHYRNFRDYIRQGGLPRILPEGVFDCLEAGRVLKNGIGIWVLRPHPVSRNPLYFPGDIC